MPQQFQETVGTRPRDIAIKTITIYCADAHADVRMVVDADHRVSGDTSALDGWQNYKGPEFSADEIGKAIDRIIAGGLNITKNQAVLLLTGLGPALARERLNPTQE